jgi:hypothetical protein
MSANEHPARPEQTDHSFETGQAHRRGPEEVFPRFSRGQDRGDAFHGKDVIPRYSRGQERSPRTREKLVEGRYSRGQERPSGISMA